MKKLLLFNLFLVSCLIASASVKNRENQIRVTQSSEDSPKTPVGSPPGSKSSLSSISDGAGGSYLVWENLSSTLVNNTYSYESKVYVQHISPSGVALWGNGMLVANSPRQQSNPLAVSDNAGGLIIAWDEFTESSDSDERENSYDVMAQRINSSGTRMWGETGKVITNAPSYQYVESIIPFGESGAVIGWDGNGAYFTILDANGNSTSGSIAIKEAQDAYIEKIMPGVEGGFSVFYYYEYTLSGSTTDVLDCYFQKYNSSGLAQFPAGGAKILSLDDNGPEIEVNDVVSDGSGGIYILIVNEDDNNKQYLQHVLNDGALAFSTPYGIVVDGASSGNGFLIPDDAGGVVVVWQDIRTPNTIASTKTQKSVSAISGFGIYAQRFSSTGMKQWATEDVIVYSGEATDNGTFQGILDNSGNFIIVFGEAIQNGTSILAQNLSPAGTPQWGPNGIVIDDTPESGTKYDVTLTPVGNTLFVFWPAQTGLGDALYSQVVNPDGTTLPVKLIEFKAALNSLNVKLTWKTGFEINNDYFEILRSVDGKTFSPIGRVSGHGSSSVLKTYSFTDNSISSGSGEIYYKLKQVDRDGASTYSAEVAVALQSFAEGLSVYPIPAREKIYVVSESRFSYKLFDLGGRVVSKGESETMKAELDISALKPGTHVLEVKSAQGKASKQIIKL